MVVENLTAENLVIESSMENAAEAQPSLQQHHYDFREGELYGYLGAISEEDRKKGVAAPPVVTYRYTGFWDGKHHLQSVDDDGTVLAWNECQVPCVAIKQTTYDGQIRRIGYNEGSIIGAAFTDAMSGRLRRSPALGTVRNGYRFTGGNPGDAANWEPTRTSLPTASPATPRANSSAGDNFVAQNMVVENLVSENLIAQPGE